MDRFAELQAFKAVIDAGGFSAAARETGQSRSTVNRLVLALEDRLGVQLLHRTTRSVSATSVGRAVHERAGKVLEELDELEMNASSARSEPVGRLRVSVPPSAGRLDFSELLVRFMERYPRVDVDAGFEARLVDLVAEGYDAVVRLAVPDEGTNLVDHRIFEVSYVICARTDYLEERDHPSTLKDLRHHRVLYQGASTPPPTWQLIGPDGQISVQLQPFLTSNSLDAVLSAVRAGFGIAIVPLHDVRAELAAGTLARVLPEYTTPVRMMQVIHPPARYLSAKVRVFLEFVEEWCRPLA